LLKFVAETDRNLSRHKSKSVELVFLHKLDALNICIVLHTTSYSIVWFHTQQLLWLHYGIFFSLCT